MSGHCGHCFFGPDSPCTGDTVTKRHYDVYDARWHSRECPACNERLRIADYIESPTLGKLDAEGLARAVRSGAHMERP